MLRIILMLALILNQSIWANSLSYTGTQVVTMAAGLVTAAFDGIGCAYSVKARLGISNITSHVERSLWASSITFGLSSLLMTVAGVSAFGPSKLTQVGEVMSGVSLALNVVGIVESAVAHGIQDQEGDVPGTLKISASMAYIAPILNFIHLIMGVYVTMRRVDDAAIQHEPAGAPV